ncbi:hypothetical protein BU17DRAFT_90082 [Hysterangium stoloniferum]|nr:hypothetical protein BU17DRAFT_90082 [Hysterangium stoloniferum]
MPEVSQLEFLRKYSGIDCDTLDVEVAKALGPFRNCTSNQGIAYSEAVKESSAQLVTESVAIARNRYPKDDVNCARYGAKVLMVSLTLRMLPYLSGCILLQSTMRAAHSESGTVQDVLETIDIYKQLSPDTSLDRICIKIPSTFEGLQACRILKGQGINTLGTTLFSVEQAILAEESGCKYVSPYINELGIYFRPGAVDANKGFPVVEEIFQYYEAYGMQTKVLAASFISTEEVMRLSGIHSITISPALLKALSLATISSDISPNYNAEEARNSTPLKRTFIHDEKSFKDALTRNSEATRKINEAVECFLEFEVRMEQMMKTALEEFNSH